MGEYYGECQGCGQIILVDAVNQMDADVQTTRQCKCEKSRELTGWWDFRTKLDEISDIAVEDKGFESIGHETRDQIETIARAVYDNKVRKVTVEVVDSTITIQKKNDNISLIRKKVVEIGG